MASRASLPKPRRDHTTSSFTELLPLDDNSERGYDSSRAIEENCKSSVQSPDGYTSLKHNDTSTWQVRGPDEGRVYRILVILTDLLLAITPLFFIYLAAASMKLNGEATHDNSFGHHLDAATKVAPTLFPIIFAAIAARSLRIIARFKAERGVRLGLLEMLMGSRSVFAAIESQILIRKFSVVGSLILALWVLSPLGGQASLRLLSRGSSTTAFDTTFRYLDTGPAAGIWPSSGFGFQGSAYNDIERALLSALIMSPDTAKLSPIDTWRNVKVPRLDAYPVGTDYSSSSWDGWTQVPYNKSSVQEFTSLIGLPVVGFWGQAEQIESVFTLETSYMDFDCSAPVDSIANDTFWNRTLGVVWGSSPTNPLNSTSQNPGQLNGGPTMFLETYLTMEDVGRQMAYLDIGSAASNASNALLGANRYIVFGSVSNNTIGETSPGEPNGALTVVTTNCSISSTHVELGVKCNHTTLDSVGCAVVAMRPSLIDKRPSTVSVFDIDVMGTIIIEQLPTTGGSQDMSLSSPVESFLSDTSLTPFHAAIFNDFVNLGSVSANDISKRLTIVMNTYTQILTSPDAFLGDRKPDTYVSPYGPPSTPIAMIDTWFSSNTTLQNVLEAVENSADPSEMSLTVERIAQLTAAPFIAASTNGTENIISETFVCNFGWAIVLLVCSLVLLALGASAAILNALLIAPDILGYVASMTYNNPDLQVNSAQLPMNAMERARRLRDLRVRIGDVRAGEDIGRVAFTAAQSSTPLQRQRTYKSIS